MDSATIRPTTDSRAQLPADTHIGQVRLRVSDLERSLRFYRDVLGLQVASEEQSRIVLQARAEAGKSRALIVLEEKPGISRRPARATTTGLYHVALLVPTRAELGRA